MRGGGEDVVVGLELERERAVALDLLRRGVLDAIVRHGGGLDEHGSARELLHHVQYLGTLSGVDFDKLELTKLPSFRARLLDTILLEGCVGWIECSVQDAIEIGDHFLITARVVAVSADDDAFDGSWKLESGDMKPLHYLGANHYAVLDYVMDARIPQSAEEYGKRLDEAVQEQLEVSKDDAERRDELEYERDEFRKREGFERS